MIEQLRGGFLEPALLVPLALFRIVFGASCLLKFFIEARRGSFNYVNSGSFLRVLQQCSGRDAWVSTLLYRCMYVVKWPCAALVLVGGGVQVSASLLLAWFVLENKVYAKFHTSLFALVCAGLLLSPSSGQALNLASLRLLIASGEILGERDLRATGSVLPQAWIVCTVSSLYLVAGLRKLNSTEFLRGDVVRAYLRFVVAERGRRHHWDGWYPERVLSFFTKGTERVLRRRSRPLMLAVALTQVSLPASLFSPRIFPFAAVAGLIMHVGLTMLFPATLLHFSLVCVGSYILFVDPAVAVDALQRVLCSP